jgi:polysaccharide pyruvyl transferase CsaB
VRFLLSGYYGFDNLGDDALLRLIIARLRTRFVPAEINVLSAQPLQTAHDYGVEATPRLDFAAVKRAIDAADVVLSGGGGLLQNATSLKSLLYYAGIIRSAVHAGKPTLIFAQSIGPLDFWGKQTVREFCKGVTAATVRDERSRELLASLLPAVEIERTADPVFLYDPPDAPFDLEASGLGAAADPLVIVAVRKTAHFNDCATMIAAAADRLAGRFDARVAFVPFGGIADAEAATLVIRKCRSRPALVPLEGLDAIAAAIARARLVIGVRLHALILAARFGVPFLAVGYDPKVGALCDDLEYPLEALWAPGQKALPERAETLADEAWRDREPLADLLVAKAAEMRGRAERNFEVLARVTGRARGA